jgi:hypothetical protein
MFYAAFFRVCHHILKQLWVSKTHKSCELEGKNSNQGILKGGSIIVPLTSCLTGLD